MPGNAATKTESASRVARRWLFGKWSPPWAERRTPTQLEIERMQLPVSDQRFEAAMRMVARAMGGTYYPVTSTIRLPEEMGEGDRTFPTEFTVLYRKFPCAALVPNVRPGDPSSSTPCVSFDVIPNVQGDPRRSKAYQSFQGPVEQAKTLFGKFLGWLKILERTLKRYLQIRARGNGVPFSRVADSLRGGADAYVGVFLTPQSRRQLLRDFPPTHREVRADHVTILYGGTPADLAKFDLGSLVRFRVVGYAEDQRGQAVVVILPPEIVRHAIRKPHVTISHVPGVKSVYSNDLIARGWKHVPARTYTGILDTHPRRHRIRTPFFPLAHRVSDSWLREKTRAV